MAEGEETVVGFPAFRASAPPPEWPPRDPIGHWTLEALARRDPAAEQSARLEAVEIARALAAQAVALAPDADTREYVERFETLEGTVWPANPLEGYGLESSLGAFLVARVAMTWAPPATRQMRETPLDGEGIMNALRDLGLDPRTASALVGDFRAAKTGFSPDPDGLPAGRLAGLAEGGITRRERDESLSQVAHSPRCLARLATATSCLERVRQVLPVLPSARLELGAGYLPAVAALILGRPDRTLDLLGHRPDQPPLVALAELARAELALARGERMERDEDPSLVSPPSAPVRPSLAPPRYSTMSVPPPSMDDDDVVEVVEEQLPTMDIETMVTPAQAVGPRVPAWASFDGDALFDAHFLAQWRGARRANVAIAASLPRVLGLSMKSGSPSLPSVAIPPEPRVLADMIQRGGLTADEASSNANTDQVDLARLRAGHAATLASPEPQFAAVRSALRAVAAAVEGWPPTEEAITRAGDLDWVLLRARILALGAAGDLAAAAALSTRIDGPLPEDMRWVEARGRRYSGGVVPVAPVAEVRRAAVALIRDLAEALARSVSGALQ